MNPRAAINDLLPFQGSPFSLLGTSPNIAECLYNITIRNSMFPSGEGGIRTHAPLRTNGFQDRLVMTTSIPLHSLFLSVSARIILTNEFHCVNNFFGSFLFFLFFQKSFRYHQIFRRRKFDVCICPLNQTNLFICHFFHHHGIICNLNPLRQQFFFTSQ